MTPPNVVAARWEMFLHAEPRSAGLRLLLTSTRSRPRRPPQRSWLCSPREPPDSSDRMISRTQGGVPEPCAAISRHWRPWGLSADGCRPRVLRRYMLVRRNRLVRLIGFRAPPACPCCWLMNRVAPRSRSGRGVASPDELRSPINQRSRRSWPVPGARPDRGLGQRVKRSGSPPR